MSDRAGTGGLHGFPAALTSFVGRASAVDQVAGQLGEYRLVTVTGPGGAGKTRLSGEVARRVAGRFADGVWLAELAAVRDPAQVAAAVAAALGIRDLPSVAPADALAHALARRHLLLVLDNCEQVIGAAAELCGQLLLGADDVRVLATSREPLRIAGETRYRLSPLTLPDPADPAAAGDGEAVTLFAERARQVELGFALDEKTGPLVARLVTRLDGLPLAIELAAARVDALGVAQLLDRIDDRFALLADADRLAAERQRSLAAAVQWSYQLLDDAGRRVFRAVAAFPGPFTLDGTVAVAGDGASRGVLHLVECSLLLPPRTGPDGRSRYSMLETLRAYAAGLLAEAGEDGEVTAAMVKYAAEVAEEASAGLYTRTGEADGLRRLDAEDITLRHALVWAMEHDPDTALRLALAQAPLWGIRGRLVSQAPLLAAAAERAEVGSDQWCGARMWLGQAAISVGDPLTALAHYAAVRQALEDPGRSHPELGPVLLVLCLSAQSSALLQADRLAEADESARRALALAGEVGIEGPKVVALTCLALVSWRAGDQDGALRLVRQAQAIPDEFAGGVDRGLSNFVTMTLIEAGDLAGAQQACTAGLAACRELGDLANLSGQLWNQTMLDLRAWPTGRGRGASARAAPDRHPDRAALGADGQPGLLRPPVRRQRAAGRGDHRVGGDVRAQASLAAAAVDLEHPHAGGVLGPGPAAARAGRDPGGAGTRRGHDRGHRHRVRPAARHRRTAGAAGRGFRARPGPAQPPGAGTAHPGRAGPHRCADRGAAVYHRAHGQLTPGPGPGQDRLPPPRRPHPPGSQRRPGLSPPLVPCVGDFHPCRGSGVYPGALHWPGGPRRPRGARAYLAGRRPARPRLSGSPRSGRGGARDQRESPHPREPVCCGKLRKGHRLRTSAFGSHCTGKVRNYLSNAISKTGAGNRIDAIRSALDVGWLQRART